MTLGARSFYSMPMSLNYIPIPASINTNYALKQDGKIAADVTVLCKTFPTKRHFGVKTLLLALNRTNIRGQRPAGE